MTQPAPKNIRFGFVTQLPRDDGCGVFVLQMLTGRPYAELAGMIDWGNQQHHYTTWKELRGVLAGLGWHAHELRRAGSWSEIGGLAVVHVEGDHFILYDAENGLFYDPGLLQGPAVDTQHSPLSYLPVRPPGSAE